MEKTWIDYRIEELEVKANTTQVPEFDMDGSRFQIDVWDDSMSDAYDWSVSERMGWKMGIIHPDDLSLKMKKRL